jgi:hypothetical protein
MVMLTSEQFATDRIIIVAYPNGAGGKFLINSLALSNQAVLQHCSLTALNSSQKIELLCHRYNNRKGERWGDIGLGCFQLFGVNQIPHSQTDLEYRDVIARLINQQKYFFLVVHNPDHLAHVVRIWSNAKVIHFTNYQDFMLTHRWLPGHHQLSNRLRAFKTWWKSRRQPDWPDRPPSTFIEYQRPEYQRIAEHIKSIEPLMIRNLPEYPNVDFQSMLGPENWHHQWDASWYLDWEQYRSHIQMLYAQLGFDDFDADKIQRLYNCWISAMQRHLHYLIDHC